MFSRRSNRTIPSSPIDQLTFILKPVVIKEGSPADRTYNSIASVSCTIDRVRTKCGLKKRNSNSTTSQAFIQSFSSFRFLHAYRETPGKGTHQAAPSVAHHSLPSRNSFFLREAVSPQGTPGSLQNAPLDSRVQSEDHLISD